tara:strand:- start:415 stop:1827 length:1413 start_codon:yes stop_codon:yes gene_type:complete
MVNPAPVRVARKSTMSSPLVQAANNIVTSPTFTKARSIDFDKKNEYDKFIKFIESSNKELLKVKLPSKEEVVKAGGLSDSKKGGNRFGLIDALGLYGGANILSRLRKFLMKRKFVPKFIKHLLTRMKRLWRNLTKPLRRFRRLVQNIAGKIKNKLATITGDVVKFLRKNIDDAITAIKNLPKAKWIKNLVTKGKSFIDDGVKIGKEFLTNSKVIKSAQTITKKIGPKLSTQLLGEITIIGGIVADVSAGFYRLSKGDKTGAALSFLSAIPIIGLPVAAVDIARDMNMLENTALKLNKDNPNYVDERTDEEKQTDADLDEYLREKYINDIKEQLENLKGVGGKDAQRKRMGLTTRLRDFEKSDLTSSQLRTKTKDLVDFKLFGEDSASHDEIQKFLDNTGSSEITSDDSSSVTTIINNSQTFLLPSSDNSQSMFSGSSTPNINITTNIVDFDYSKASDFMADELLFLKLDK